MTVDIAHAVRREVRVKGTSISYAVAGQGPTTVVLIHGYAAHGMWWHLVAPQLMSEHRVIVMDLSGNGRSGHRDVYGPGLHAAEVLAAVEQESAQSVLLTGHSMGGRVAVVAAAELAERAVGVVVLDTLFRDPQERTDDSTSRWGVRGPRDRQDLVSRFRLMPDQPVLPAATVDPVADYGIVQTSGGWQWRFDAQPPVYDDSVVNASLHRLRCPVTYAYGERSVLPSQMTVERILQVQPTARILQIAGGHHHLPLDSPDECTALIRQAAVAPTPEKGPSHEDR